MSIRATGRYWLNSMISARDISGKPEKVSAHNFSIHLLGCSLGDSQHPGNVFQRANITFSGAPDRTIQII